MKRQKILNYMRRIDELIKSGEYILFTTALAFYMRGDIWDVEKLKEEDFNEVTNYVSRLDSILNEDIIDKVEEKIGSVL